MVFDLFVYSISFIYNIELYIVICIYVCIHTLVYMIHIYIYLLYSIAIYVFNFYAWGVPEWGVAFCGVKLKVKFIGWFVFKRSSSWWDCILHIWRFLQTAAHHQIIQVQIKPCTWDRAQYIYIYVSFICVEQTCQFGQAILCAITFKYMPL